VSDGIFHDNSGDVQEKTDDQIKEPEMYRVLLHNDDYTTMNFVVEILIKIFHKSLIDATRIMIHVHRNGKCEAGVYTYDIASTKVEQVHRRAKSRQFPLKCTMEKI
jgi:ATP-dependent Clp protease adaptor protein ClpS